MKKILVLCTGNSCRSQMAEAYIRHYAGGKAEVFSAGLETHGLNPRAVKVMAEDGFDISRQTSNNVKEYTQIPFDLIITVCDHAAENCPVFHSKAKKIHKSFPDPAKATGSEENILGEFRKVRDAIKEFSKQLVQESI